MSARAFPLLAGSLLLVVIAAVVMAARPGQDIPGESAGMVPEPVTARIGDPGEFSGWGQSHFPHEYHVSDLAIACIDCHHETNATRLNVPHEDYFEDYWIDCTICHRNEHDLPLEPRYCGDCHHDSPNGTADETLSAKVVIHQLCWDCHDQGTGAEAAENCGFCHDSVTGQQ